MAALFFTDVLMEDHDILFLHTVWSPHKAPHPCLYIWVSMLAGNSLLPVFCGFWYWRTLLAGRILVRQRRRFSVLSFLGYETSIVFSFRIFTLISRLQSAYCPLSQVYWRQRGKVHRYIVIHILTQMVCVCALAYAHLHENSNSCHASQTDFWGQKGTFDTSLECFFSFITA